MKKIVKLLLKVGIVAVSVKALAGKHSSGYKMSMDDYKEYVKKMAVLDDKICRNELSGFFVKPMLINQSDEDGTINSYKDSSSRAKEIVFPEEDETFAIKYSYFFERNKGKTKKELDEELEKMKQRLKESNKYLNEEKRELDIEFRF